VLVQRVIGVASSWIAIECLNCRHRAAVSPESLPRYGLEPDASLVTLTKRLVCTQCGSKAVQAYRCADDDIVPPPLAPP
jgi:hypothetical protein